MFAAYLGVYNLEAPNVKCVGDEATRCFTQASQPIAHREEHMNRSHVWPGSLVIAVLIALAFGIFFWGFSGSTAGGLTTAQETQTNPAGTSESILVHGAWEINILEPDGTLVSSQVFDNDLFQAGEDQLAEFLSREKIPGLWRIVLLGNDLNVHPCLDDQSTPQPFPCEFLETADTAIGNPFQHVLEVSRPVSPGDTVRLFGQGVAQHEGDIKKVRITVGSCTPTATPLCSSDWNITVFTSTTLPTAEPVLEGQIIQVEVTLSFGTLPP